MALHLETVRCWTSRLCGTLLIALGIYIAVKNLAAQGDWLGAIVLVSVILVLGIELIRYRRWARKGVAILLVLFVVFFPIGYLNPFTAGDLIAEYGEAPTVQEVLVWLIPLEITFLILAWLLDPPRNK